MHYLFGAKIIKKSLSSIFIPAIFNDILNRIDRGEIILKIFSSFFDFFACYQPKKK